MASLFISHSSSDLDATKRVAERLAAEGFAALFLDFDPVGGIAAGRAWESELYVQLRKADGVIFLASATSVASQWCFAEISLARSLSKPIFPLRLEAGVRLSLLNDVQWIDLMEGETAFARLWSGLRRAGLDPADSFGWDPTRSPYPGLESFTSDDAAVFFGRDDEINKLVELVQPTLQRGAGRFVAVVGPSGSGKSSLVRAGLLPRLERLHSRWVVLPALVPGQQPTRNLVHCLATAFETRGQQFPLEDIATALRRSGEGLVELAGELGELAGSALRGGAPSGRVNVLVVIDQAEELLTRTGVREQQAFLSLLRGALGEDSPVWVVATMRSEFLSTAPERAGLAELVDDPLVIEPLSRARLPIVILQPAQHAGLLFAPGLVEQMVEETTGGDALPLLAYMLRELYQQAGADGLVTVAEYQELGGVVGALQRRADRLADELNRRGGGDAVLPTLTKFAVVHDDAEPTSRRISRSALARDELRVVDTFVEARLLTSSVAANGERVVGVAHEALLRQWRPLREAIEASRASLRMRSELERLAADWDLGGRDDSYLLSGARLSTLGEWAVDHSSEVGPRERQFIEAAKALASRALERARRSNRRLRALTASLMVLVLAIGSLAGLLFLANQEVSRQRDVAVSRQLIAESEDLGKSDPGTARLKSLAAWRIHSTDDARLAMLSAASLPGIVAMRGHTDDVNAVAFSSDGKTVASGSRDGSVGLWDVATHRQVGSLRGHIGPVNAVAFSTDGKIVASGSRDGSVRLWDVASHRQIGFPLTGHTGGVWSVAFRPDGNTLASGGRDGSVRLWGVASHRQLGSTLTGHTGPVFSVAFSPDGKALASASGGGDDTVRLWDVASHRQIGSTLTGHTAGVHSVAFSPNGKTLASGSLDATVRLWDVTSHRQIGSPLTGHTAGVHSVAFSPNGKTLASGSRDDTVRLWDVTSHRMVRSPLTGHTDFVTTVAFSPDGKTIASGSFDDSVRLWDVATHRQTGSSLLGHADAVLSVAFSPNGRTLASASGDTTLRLWDVATHHQVGSPLVGHTNFVTSVAFSPDGKTVASGSWDDSVRLWDVASHRLIGSLTGHTGGVTSVAFSPDGRTLASGSQDTTVRLWDVTNHQQIGPQLTGHTDGVTSVAFSPDGRTLASGSQDTTVRLWDVTNHQQIGPQLTGHSNSVTSVAFSPDGKTLATGSWDKSVRLWDVASDRQTGSPLTGHTDTVDSVAFSPDSKNLASGSADDSVWLWDVTTRHRIGSPLTGHVNAVLSVAFSPDGRTLATGSSDESVRLWDVPDLVDPAAFLCQSIGQSPTRDQWRSLIPKGPKYRPLCP